MRPTELARVFADHFAYTVRGNWIVDERGTPVGGGWEHFAARLEQRSWIRQGVGVHWRRIGETPRLGRVERTGRGHWATN